MQTLAPLARRTLAGLAFLVFALAAVPAPAAIITVTNTNDDGAGSLRAAIDGASTNPLSSDTVAFDLPPNSTIVLQSTLTIDRDIVIDGGGSGNFTLSGGGAVRVFDVVASVVFTIENLAIVNGRAIRGGGIYNQGGVTLTRCTVAGNSATSNSGGGIYNEGMLVLNDSIVTGNSAAGGGGGGGIFSSDARTGVITPALTLNRSVVIGNSADAEGGGINNAVGTAYLTDSTISGNTTKANGGGLSNHDELRLIRSTVSGNSADNGGGGILNDGAGMLYLVNSTITGNSAHSGGGISNSHVLSATHVTLAGNTAGGNADDLYNDTGAEAGFINTLIQSCIGGGTYADNGGNFDAGSGCGVASSRSNATLDLGLLQDNGGATLTMLPGSASDALGQGTALGCEVGSGGVDQRSAARPTDLCTSGAVQAGAGAPRFRLTVAVTGLGSVGDDATPAQIDNCATTGRANCTGIYDAGGSVQLTAIPAAGQTFASWGGACSGTDATTTVAMSQARACTASFAPAATTATAAAVPTLNQWALLLLAALLAAASAGAARVNGRQSRNRT